MAHKFLTIGAGGLLAEATEIGVTSVTGTAPVVSSGGTTPAISMAAAAVGVAGYVSTSAQTFDGVKTFTNGISLGNENLTVYDEGTWTPDYAVAGQAWSTAPTTVYATYVRVGKMVTVTLFATNGVCADYTSIGGLPFACGSTSGGATAAMTSGDVAKKFTCRIYPGHQYLSIIPAQALTGAYWNLSATYLV